MKQHELRFERSFRLVLSLASLGVGACLLSKGYDAAYLGKENERPNGNSEQWAHYLLGGFAWIVSICWSRVRIVSWAFTLLFGCWCSSTATLLFNDQYYVMGRDGCLPCGNQTGFLYFGVSLIGLCAGVFALIFRIQDVNDWRIVAGMALTVAWGMGSRSRCRQEFCISMTAWDTSHSAAGREKKAQYSEELSRNFLERPEDSAIALNQVD